MAALLSIPNVQVLSLEESGDGLRLVVETKEESALCPSCTQSALPAGRRTVELDSVKPFLGRSVHLTWQTRVWTCENKDCPTGTFYELADWPFSKG